MINGVYELYLRFKRKGRLRYNVTWWKFYYSKCWYSKYRLTEKQVKYNEENIFKRSY